MLEFLISSSGFIFEWDTGNLSKSEDKHGISTDMIESVFEDPSILALGEQFQPPVKDNEDRYGVIGKAHTTDILFVCFTIREGRIRAISSRSASKNERSIYDEKIC